MDPLSKQERNIENLIDEIRSVVNYDLDKGRVEYYLTTAQCISRILNLINRPLYLASIYGQAYAIVTEDKLEDFQNYAWETEGEDVEYNGDGLPSGWSKNKWLEDNVSFEQLIVNKFE